MHKWRNYGESALIAWKEPGFIPFVKTQRYKHVLSQRECSRCGVKQKRIFSENADGTMAAAGWEIVK
jgi:hypothetical protein